MSQVLRLLEQEFSVAILSIRIIGRRWSNEGEVMQNLPLGPSHRIQVTDGAGFIVYGWHRLGPEQKNELSGKLKEIS